MLAITKVAAGLMFHILSIIVILVLGGVFIHSIVRMVMLQKRRKARKYRQRTRRQVDNQSGSELGRTQGSGSLVDVVPEIPIQVSMVGDETSPQSKSCVGSKSVKLPPPVYGHTRNSRVSSTTSVFVGSELTLGQRMNPELMYWKKMSPSPTTPTYEEAMRNAHVAVGLQPPMYVSPRKGIDMISGARQRDSNVHPLERQRLHGLLHS